MIKAVLELFFAAGDGTDGCAKLDGGDFECEVAGGAVIVTGYKGTAKDVAIPGVIGGLPVTAIGDWAFARKQLTGITIPDSVRVIGNGAFKSNNLTGVTVPGSVRVVGDAAFQGNRLTGVTVPANADIQASSFYSLLYAHYTAVGRKAAAYTFERCATGGFEIVIFMNAAEITGYTGREKTVAVPDAVGGKPVTAIGNGAFLMNKLTGVTIPDSVTVIEDSAFYGNNLTSVTVPCSVAAIGDFAFAKNPLDSVTVGAGVKARKNTFPGNLAKIYTNGGRQAGTYVFVPGNNGKIWTKQ
jgi:hypothetical protein